jgi:GR25 family glycosyltransferase involved in LPS biosynthesis
LSLAPLLDHVDRIIVITLPSAGERHELISAVLTAHGLPFEFHMGRDARQESVESLIASGEYDSNARSLHDRHDLTPAETGCAISHRQVAANLLAGSDRRVLILEDDAFTLPDGLRHFSESMRSLPAEWNLAYFGYAPMNLKAAFAVRLKLMTYYPVAQMLGSKRHDRDSIRRIYTRRLNSQWMHAGWFNNAHAYAIDRQAAEFIVKIQTPVSLEADVALGHLVRFSGLNAICQKYPLFDQRLDIPSTIGARPSWE